MFIGIDIGGTHTRVALGEKGQYRDKKDFPTEEFPETLQKIKESVGSFDGKSKAVGVSVAGPFNFQSNTLHNPPNLPESWKDKVLPEIFSKELSIPTFVAHDASVAALGEAVHGAGKGKNPVLYYTVSTGIGSGLVVNGKIYHGAYNPEAGHQILAKDGEPCRCGQLGDLEALASGEALEKKAGKKPADVEGSSLWNEAMEWVAVGLTNSILHFSPEIVVIGGGMTKHGDVFFKPVTEALAKYLKFVPSVPVVPAGLGQESGLIGAIELAEQSLSS